MSRFFRVEDSDSDRSTSESDSEDEKKPKAPVAAAKKAATPAAAAAAAGTAAKPAAPAKSASASNMVASKWMKGSSDSDSSDESSESDSDSSSSGSSSDEGDKKPSRFLKGDSDSDEESEEETKRVVKSHKDKRFDEMRGIVHAIENGRKINDWVAVQNEFDKLTKAFDKAKSIIDKEGIPPFYIRNLAQLEDANKKLLENKDAVKKMNSSNAKAVNAMKQKLRKYNKAFEEKIEGYRANPAGMESGSDEEVVEKKKEDKKKAPAVKVTGASKWAKGAAADESESESEDESESESESSSESSSSEEGKPKRTGISKWLKKPAKKTAAESASSSDEKKPSGTAPVKRKVVAEQLEPSDDEGFQTVTDKKSQVPKEELITLDNLFKKLKEVVEARGRKSTDKAAQVKTLLKMLGISQTPHQKIKVLLVLVPSLFDYNPSMSSHLGVETWKEAAKYLDQLLTIVDSTPTIQIRDSLEEDEDEASNELLAKEGKPIQLLGSINGLVDRLDDEFYRSLQNIDPHTSEYIDRLRDEAVLYGLIVRSQLYCEKAGSGVGEEMVSMVLLRRLEHLYYKSDQLVKILDDESRKIYPSVASLPADSPDTLIHNLAVRLYKQSNERLRTRALLCHVYYHALHDRYYQARDLLLMSHLQESISHADVSTQVLYNRALVQIGLSAFRLGLVRDAQGALQEIMLSGKQKELLAQGFQMARGREEKTAEQERLEKARQLPFHMHINLELLECVYLVASMLLEIPNMAANRHDSGRKVISRMFRKMLSYNERQVFTGPPENMRDHVMAAARALSSGDWAKATELVNAIKVWELMPNAPKIKEMLGRKIQEEALRTYLFSYGVFYETLNLADLAEMSGLSQREVHKVVSRMINNEEISASMDETTSTVMMHAEAEQTRLQYLAAAYADKVNNLVDSNEKLLEQRFSTVAQQQDTERGAKGGRGERGGRGGRGQFRGGRGGGRPRGGGGGGGAGGQRRDRY